MLALCRWFAVNRFQGEHYSLTVLVNEATGTTLDVDPRSRHALDRGAPGHASERG